MLECRSLEEVRANIDALDEQIIRLLARRSEFVRQAARFKRDVREVQAPQRVEQVISKVRALAENESLDPSVAEAVYRAVISRFIEAETMEHSRLQTAPED